MKNLMIYISATGSFDNENDKSINDAATCVKIQIDNCLSLGWKTKDILLVTNFDYQYGPIKAITLKDIQYFRNSPQASKINAIIRLFEKGVIKKGELYWFHDLDAFQVYKMAELKLGLKNHDMALTDYGRMPRWSTGTIFFKKSSEDIFRQIREIVYSKNIDEERALDILTQDDDIKKRVKKINITYNFTGYNLWSCYKMADKPIKVAHFHPIDTLPGMQLKHSFKFFKGENKMSTPFITKSLIKIFNKHGIN